jgi:hypothetical protein
MGVRRERNVVASLGVLAEARPGAGQNHLPGIRARGSSPSAASVAATACSYIDKLATHGSAIARPAELPSLPMRLTHDTMSWRQPGKRLFTIEGVVPVEVLGASVTG